MIDHEEMAKDVRAIFGTPEGRSVLQQILDYAGNNEAPGRLEASELWMRQGARALALDLAVMAGALPEVPGSTYVRREPDRADTALEGAPPPEGDSDDSERALT